MRVYWLVNGLLAGSSRPGAYSSLSEDLEQLRQAGISAILSLSEMGLDEWALAEHGFVWEHMPIEDMAAPQSHHFQHALAFIDEQLATGRATVVHCLAGQGRTGSILAAWLIRNGSTAAGALEAIRAVCPGAVENPAQEAALEAFAARQDWLI